MRRALAIVSSVMLLSGCGGEPVAQNTASAPSTPDPVESQIDNLAAPLKDVAFFRAIRDAGFTCQRVTRSEPRPRNEGRAAWMATCDDGAEYGIVLQPGGTFLVTGANQRR